MRDPLEIRVRDAIEEMADKGSIPLGIVSFDMKREELILSLFPGVDTAEASALLQKIGIKANFT